MRHFVLACVLFVATCFSAVAADAQRSRRLMLPLNAPVVYQCTQVMTHVGGLTPGTHRVTFRLRLSVDQRRLRQLSERYGPGKMPPLDVRALDLAYTRQGEDAAAFRIPHLGWLVECNSDGGDPNIEYLFSDDYRHRSLCHALRADLHGVWLGALFFTPPPDGVKAGDQWGQAPAGAPTSLRDVSGLDRWTADAIEQKPYGRIVRMHGERRWTDPDTKAIRCARREIVFNLTSGRVRESLLRIDTPGQPNTPSAEFRLVFGPQEGGGL